MRLTRCSFVEARSCLVLIALMIRLQRKQGQYLPNMKHSIVIGWLKYFAFLVVKKLLYCRILKPQSIMSDRYAQARYRSIRSNLTVMAEIALLTLLCKLSILQEVRSNVRLLPFSTIPLHAWRPILWQTSKTTALIRPYIHKKQARTMVTAVIILMVARFHHYTELAPKICHTLNS